MTDRSLNFSCYINTDLQTYISRKKRNTSERIHQFSIKLYYLDLYKARFAKVIYYFNKPL